MCEENKKFKIVNVKEDIQKNLSEGDAVTQFNDHKIDGHFYSNSEGKNYSAKNQKSNITHKYEGDPPNSRENELNVATILIQKLNEKRKIYSSPELVEETNDIVDCISKSLIKGIPDLKIQVVNSIVNTDYWRKIASEGFNNASNFAEVLSNEIFSAIKNKTEKYDSYSINDILLALDATNNPQHALTDVVENLKNNYDCSVGFLHIWLIGPNSMMTHKIV